MAAKKHKKHKIKKRISEFFVVFVPFGGHSKFSEVREQIPNTTAKEVASPFGPPARRCNPAASACNARAVARHCRSAVRRDIFVEVEPRGIVSPVGAAYSANHSSTPLNIYRAS
jgi:hypothetical protein